MSELIFSVAVFLAAHIIPSHQKLRQLLVNRMGERIFMSVYGVISLALFVWLLMTYLAAPYVELWMMADWMRYCVLFVMFWVCLLLVCTFSQPNPFSIGIGAKGFDPHNPGIVALTKHPGFVAFALWSSIHILPNGDVASIIFFGLMTALSLYGPKSLNDKRRQRMGEETWTALDASMIKGWPHIGWKRWLGAGLLYITLLHAHGPVIGVEPYLW